MEVSPKSLLGKKSYLNFSSENNLNYSQAWKCHQKVSGGCSRLWKACRTPSCCRCWAASPSSAGTGGSSRPGRPSPCCSAPSWPARCELPSAGNRGPAAVDSNLVVEISFVQGLLYHRTCKCDFLHMQLAFAKFLSKIKGIFEGVLYP